MRINILIFLLFAGIANAQVKIGSNPAIINPASILELESTSKGFLPPRMLYAQKILIPNPPAGLIIWCIDCGTSGELQVFNGKEWTNLVGDIASGVFSIPVLTTTTVSNITSITASSGGTVTNNGGKTITALGVCWGSTSLPTIGSSKTIDSGTIGTFTSAITGLNPFTDYFVRAYATNAIGTAYGNELTFKTQVGLSSVNTDIASSITATTATSGGNVISDGGSTISERGICWSLVASPTIADGKLTSLGTTGVFVSNLSGLIPASLYHVRAYSTNANGTAYGNEITFTTVAGLPLVSTAAITSVGSTSATSGGNVSSDGGVTITARGICWGTTVNPTTADSKITDATTTTGTFVGNLSGLNLATTYHVRAYATNSFGTTYGDDLTFTTDAVTPVIGVPYQGGTIGYIFQLGDPGYVAGETHGIIVATTDQSTDISWIVDGSTAITAPVTSVDLGSGSTNTNLILAATDTTTSFAAQIARAYTNGGYSDWSLPSLNELLKIFENHVVLGLADDQYYWTSSTYFTPAGDLAAYVVRSYLYVDSNGIPLYYDSNGNPQPYIQSDVSTVYGSTFQAFVRAIRLF